MVPSTVSAIPLGIALVGGALASVLAAGLASGCLTAGMGAGDATAYVHDAGLTALPNRSF